MALDGRAGGGDDGAMDPVTRHAPRWNTVRVRAVAVGAARSGRYRSPRGLRPGRHGRPGGRAVPGTRAHRRGADRPAARRPGRGPRTILTVEPGDIFGWSAVLHGSSASSTAVTLLPTRAFLFDRDRLSAAMAADCELAAAVYRCVLGAVARRLVATRSSCSTSTGRRASRGDAGGRFPPARGLDTLIRPARRRRSAGRRADRRRRGDRLRRADLGRAAALGLDGGNESRTYRVVPAGRNRAFDYTTGPTSEALHPSAAHPADPRPTRGRRGQDRGGRGGGAAARLPRRPGLRDRRPRDPGAGDARRAARRRRPRRPPRRRPRRGRRVRGGDRAPASAPRWAAGPRSATAPISSCPSSTTGTSSGPAAPAGAAIVDRLDAATGRRRASSTGRRARSRPSGRRSAIRCPTDGLPERLRAALDHPRWAEVAERCLACANCTLVCPTCFCTSVGVASDLDGVEATDRSALGQLLQPRLRARRRRRQLPAEGQGPLSPVADPQVLDLVGPVRLERLRRLRSLHRLVPGRDRRPRRAWRAIAPPSAPAGPIPWPVAGRAGRGPAGRARARRARPPRHGATVRSVARDRRHRHPRAGTRRSGPPGRSARPVRHGRAAGVRRAADLDLADPTGLASSSTIRSAGAATAALTALATGAQVALRGPLGRGWPIETAIGRDVVIVAGGIGLAPLRPLHRRGPGRAAPVRGRAPLPRRTDARTTGCSSPR